MGVSIGAEVGRHSGPLSNPRGPVTLLSPGLFLHGACARRPFSLPAIPSLRTCRLRARCTDAPTGR